MGELRYALAACFFHALGDTDLATKRAVVEVFLGQEELTGDGKKIGKSEFLETMWPVLRSNLQDEGTKASDGESTATSCPVRVRLLLAPSGNSAEVTLPVADACRVAVTRR